MEDWEINLYVSWPHDRCLLGWSFLHPDDQSDYNTLEFFLFIVSIQFNWK